MFRYQRKCRTVFFVQRKEANQDESAVNYINNVQRVTVIQSVRRERKLYCFSQSGVSVMGSVAS